ncbi:MAG: ribosome-associated translation inhibitor RaiA [Oscillospiraceae bacterium]|nr:ribosome-associated translation inhibitor RaiA [Oscillospiraceae bacterium]
MKFTFATKKTPLNDSIKDYAEKKISKLDRYFRSEAEANVTFSVEKGNRCVVEVTIRGGNTLFRAEEEAPDGNMHGAIDAAQSYIERQIRKNKTRLEKRLRQDAFEPSADDADVPEEKEFDIIRKKHFAIKPMMPEEAILQMNLLDHTFFVFRDSESNALSIVYQRKNGGYGLIETDDVQ